MTDTASPPPASRAEALAILTASGQPYELATLEIGGYPRKIFAAAPPTLREMFAAAVSDATFLVYGEERLTFAEVARDAARLASVLVTRFGVGKGDRVAFSMRNFPEWVIVYQAATSIGAVAVAMNALWQSDELEYGLKDSGAKVFIADQERLDRLAGCSPDLIVPVIAVRADRPGKAARYEDLMAEAAGAALPAADIAPDDDATIFYTSGSTGHPKGVVSSHRNIISALFSWELDVRAGGLVAGIEPVPPARQPVALLGVPLFHVTGANAIFLQCYRAQRAMVCMYKWDAELAAEIIEREHVTSFTAPAAMTGDLVREAKRTSRDLSSLLTVGGGGAPRAPEQVAQIGSSFGQAMPNTGWGMTETNAIGTGIGGEEYLNRPASSGRCSAVLELKILDEQGRALPAGERGELLIRGTSVFGGYWNRAELNAEIFEDGWFRTGDVAYLDDEGYLFIVDRIKDLIIRGGENIGCGQVEAALLKHPHIHEAAVYAVPDERLGEEVGATVHGDPGLDPDEIRDFLKDQLARFEVPRYIDISPEPLPRIASGKILKRGLRDEAARRLAAAPKT